MLNANGAVTRGKWIVREDYENYRKKCKKLGLLPYDLFDKNAFIDKDRRLINKMKSLKRNYHWIKCIQTGKK